MSAVYAVYFSPTRSSRTITLAIASSMAHCLGYPLKEADVTLPAGRSLSLPLAQTDVLVCGFPVYGGRVPLPFVEWLPHLTGQGTPTVVAAVYGNREYEDALLEAGDLLRENGFQVLGAGAFIAEHSYTHQVGTGRPDKDDLDTAASLGESCADKLRDGQWTPPVLPGNRPYKERKAAAPLAPLTADTCTRCGACVKVCPMGVIHADNPALTDSGCLGCMACVKRCPLGSKSFDSPRIQQITAMLEANCREPKQPSIFL